MFVSSEDICYCYDETGCNNRYDHIIYHYDHFIYYYDHIIYHYDHIIYYYDHIIYYYDHIIIITITLFIITITSFIITITLFIITITLLLLRFMILMKMFEIVWSGDLTLPEILRMNVFLKTTFCRYFLFDLVILQLYLRYFRKIASQQFIFIK